MATVTLDRQRSCLRRRTRVARLTISETSQRPPAQAGVLFLTRRAGLPSLLPAQENKRNKHS